jgi:hypothetical protein
MSKVKKAAPLLAQEAASCCSLGLPLGRSGVGIGITRATRPGNPYYYHHYALATYEEAQESRRPQKTTNLVLRENELPICDDIKDAISALDQLRLGTDSSDILAARLVARGR